MVSRERIVEASQRVGNGGGAVFRIRGSHPWAVYPLDGGWSVETLGFKAWYPRIGVWFSCPQGKEPLIQVAFYRETYEAVARMGWLASDLTAIDDIEPDAEGRYREALA